MHPNVACGVTGSAVGFREDGGPAVDEWTGYSATVSSWGVALRFLRCCCAASWLLWQAGDAGLLGRSAGIAPSGPIRVAWWLPCYCFLVIPGTEYRSCDKHDAATAARRQRTRIGLVDLTFEHWASFDLKGRIPWRSNTSTRLNRWPLLRQSCGAEPPLCANRADLEPVSRAPHHCP